MAGTSAMVEGVKGSANLREFEQDQWAAALHAASWVTDGRVR
jgi:hypothetical protein